MKDGTNLALFFLLSNFFIADIDGKDLAIVQLQE